MQSAGDVASAVALAVLSTEESSKGLLCHWGRADTKKIVSHKEKHANIGVIYSVLITLNLIASFAVLMVRSKPKDQRILDNQSLFSKLGKDGFLMEDFGKFLSLMNEMEKAQLDSYISEFKDLYHQSELLKLAESGEIDKMKQRALYVDFNQNGELASNPESITVDDATAWISHAERSLALLQKFMRAPEEDNRLLMQVFLSEKHDRT